MPNSPTTVQQKLRVIDMLNALGIEISTERMFAMKYDDLRTVLKLARDSVPEVLDLSSAPVDRAEGHN